MLCTQLNKSMLVAVSCDHSLQLRCFSLVLFFFKLWVLLLRKVLRSSLCVCVQFNNKNTLSVADFFYFFFN